MSLSLSEAIRLGATLRPQAFGRFFRSTGSCALGAAAEADGIAGYSSIGLLNAISLEEMILDRWPYLEMEHVPVGLKCPVCGSRTFGQTLSSLIIHLNDWHKISREEIAIEVAAVEKIIRSREMNQIEEMSLA